MSDVIAGEILRPLERRDPRLIVLAGFLSIAARIEPALVRAVRLALIPEGDAGLEADFWHSELVEARDASAAALVPECAASLQDRLGRQATTEALARLWQVLSRVHEGLAPALASQERLAFLALRPSPDDRKAIAEELQRFRRALAGAQGQALAEWLAEAMPRFPEDVQLTPAAAALYRTLRSHLPEMGGSLRGPVAPGKSASQKGGRASEVTISVRGLSSGLELTGGRRPGALELSVPSTIPAVLDVSWPTVEGWESRRVALEEGASTVVHVPLGLPWRVTSVDGTETVLRTALGPDRPLLHVSGAAGERVRSGVAVQTADLFWDLRWGTARSRQVQVKRSSRGGVASKRAAATLLLASNTTDLLANYDDLASEERRHVLIGLRGWVMAVSGGREEVSAQTATLLARVHEGPFEAELRAALLRHEQAVAREVFERRHAIPRPGAHADAQGTRFAVFSSGADRVELCVFDPDGYEVRHEMMRREEGLWTVYIPEFGPGGGYGYRAHGPWAPERGQRFNAAKLLLDPYARLIEGDVHWDPAVFAHGRAEREPNREDSAPFVPRSVVANDGFDWEDDTPPRVPWEETVIYETHVKGLTERHPDVPPALRGTYAGASHPAVIEHLQALGITAVELLPVQHFVHEHALVERGLRNYWGYNPIGFFAPYGGYAQEPGQEVIEFKQMVKVLHAAGIEVILDVVFNHTAEGNHLGPALSFRGLDNTTYYHLHRDDPRHYMDFSGTGNALDAGHPRVVQLMVDALRYWAGDMHVDGFRFDLATALSRRGGGHPDLGTSPLFTAITQDPVLSGVKLIAEPWDVGPGGYQLGNFPEDWREWNVRYREAVRDFWRGESSTAELATRMSGSADLFGGSRAGASINYVTAHDGFTLADLVSYDQKHNDANGERNLDGETHNRSWNCGVEGPTDDPVVLRFRLQQRRNLLATLLLSEGVPMLLGGDEIGRTQRGNNNAWCQDNEISWYDWDAADRELLAFTQQVIAFRREHCAVFSGSAAAAPRRKGEPAAAPAARSADWIGPDGAEMTEAAWASPTRIVGRVLRAATGPDDVTRFLVIVNGQPDPVPFVLPPPRYAPAWTRMMDTSDGFVEDSGRYLSGSTLDVPGRSIVVLRAWMTAGSLPVDAAQQYAV